MPDIPRDIDKAYQQFLLDHTSGKGRPVYAEALQWLEEKWTFQRVMSEWKKGDDLLWLLEGVGLITRDEATKLACTCVDRCGDMAPDVMAVSDAVRKGELTAAAFGAAAIMGNAEGKEAEPIKEGKEPILPVAELKAYPGADKARYAATLLLDDSKPYMAMSHSVQAKVHEARDAWAQALRDAAISEGGVVDENGVIWNNSESARLARVEMGDDGSVWHDGERVSNGGNTIVINNSGVFVDDVCVKAFPKSTADLTPVELHKSTIDKAIVAELAAAIPRVEASEHLAHAEIVRAYWGAK